MIVPLFNVVLFCWQDEIAGIILRVLQPIGKAQEFLVNIVMNEVDKLGM